VHLLPSGKDLAFIKERLETEKVVPVIGRPYPLSEATEALQYFEEGYNKEKRSLH